MHLEADLSAVFQKPLNRGSHVARDGGDERQVFSILAGGGTHPRLVVDQGTHL